MRVFSAATLVIVTGVASAQTVDTGNNTPITATQTNAAVVTAIAKNEINGTSALLPANTQVDVTLNSEVSSKKMKQGESFTVGVSRDVMLGNYVIIPRGTPGTGHISYRTGKGAFGKSAKMEIEITNLDLNGRAIPVSGKFRQEGQGNTGATVGTAVAVGVFSAFVTGRSAIFEQGRELRVFTKESIPVAIPGPAEAPAATNNTVAPPEPAKPASLAPAKEVFLKTSE